MPKIYSRFDQPDISGLDCGFETRTHVEFLRECDINYLVKRYIATGSWGPSDGRAPMDGLHDYPSDYQAMLDAVIAAREQFDSLPSSIRDRFANDPQRLIDFLADESNRSEAEKLGLIVNRVRDPDPQPALQHDGVVESGTRGDGVEK